MNKIKVPQCPFCPLSEWQPGLAATATDAPEPGGHLCTVTGEFIPEGQEPYAGKCEISIGYRSHPFEIAMGVDNHEDMAAWLRENLPSEVLELLRDDRLEIAKVRDWNDHPIREVYD